MKVEIGHAYRFNYPKEFVTLPNYTAHAGQSVVVLRQLSDAEADAGEVGRMYEVRAGDGWIGHACEDELEEIAA